MSLFLNLTFKKRVKNEPCRMKRLISVFLFLVEALNEFDNLLAIVDHVVIKIKVSYA